jgi:hypothetical protein
VPCRLTTAHWQRAILQAVYDAAAATPAVRPPPTPEDLLNAMPQDVRDEAMRRLLAPDLLDWLRLDVRAMGLAGEESLAEALYLFGVSRLLDRPLGWHRARHRAALPSGG